MTKRGINNQIKKIKHSFNVTVDWLGELQKDIHALDRMLTDRKTRLGKVK